MIFIVNRQTSASILVPTVWGPFESKEQVDNLVKTHLNHYGVFDVIEDGKVLTSFSLEKNEVKSAPPPLQGS